MGEYCNIGIHKGQLVLEDWDGFLFLRGARAGVGEFDVEVSI